MLHVSCSLLQTAANSRRLFQVWIINPGDFNSFFILFAADPGSTHTHPFQSPGKRGSVCSPILQQRTIYLPVHAMILHLFRKQRPGWCFRSLLHLQQTCRKCAANAANHRHQKRGYGWCPSIHVQPARPTRPLVSPQGLGEPIHRSPAGQRKSTEDSPPPDHPRAWLLSDPNAK